MKSVKSTSTFVDIEQLQIWRGEMSPQICGHLLMPATGALEEQKWTPCRDWCVFFGRTADTPYSAVFRNIEALAYDMEVLHKPYPREGDSLLIEHP
jgi:hypothetical protein